MKGLVLRASIRKTYSSSTPQPGRNVIEIQQAGGRINKNRLLVGSQCELLVMWVRVLGPEIFAGQAKAIDTQQQDVSSTPCHWEFSFDLQEPGDYQLDVKVLSWNPNTAVIPFRKKTRTVKDWKALRFRRSIQCPFSPGGPEKVKTDKYPFHEGIKGFKFY